jgi:hypothetical protein
MQFALSPVVSKACCASGGLANLLPYEAPPNGPPHRAELRTPVKIGPGLDLDAMGLGWCSHYMYRPPLMP